MEEFLSGKSSDVLHRYFLKSRQYMRAAEVMFAAAFKVGAACGREGQEDATPIDHRYLFLTACINDLNAAKTGRGHVGAA